MKVRLPLSLLFACAVSAVAAIPSGAADSSSSITILTPTDGPKSVFDDKLIGKQWQWYPEKDGINIAPVWKDGITGSGDTPAFRGFVKSSGLLTSSVVIGIVDEWVEPNHEDLNVSPYYSTENPNGLSKDFVGSETIPTDDPETEEDESLTQIYTDESHGTFVAGMAAAIGGNDIGVVGAAPEATIAGLHFNGTDEAFYWKSGVSESTGAYTGEAAIQVKNCSWGYTFTQEYYDAQFGTAIELTSKNNVIYVFAAGNARGGDDEDPGTTGWQSAGNIKSIINVAATDSSGIYSDFSCFGSNVFISAPGAEVVSTDRTGTNGYNTTTSLSSSDSTTTDSENTGVTISNNNYAASDGTSFSAPLVAGVIALGKEVCPVMDVRWAKHALAYSSGYGESPNIDYAWDAEKKTYVQKSGYTQTVTDEETGETTKVTVSPTGDWQKNSGGYWFNNNYGFGLVDAEGFVDKVRNIAYTTVETTASVDGSALSEAVSSTSSGSTRYVEYAVRTFSGSGDEDTSVSVFDQKLETVSVTVKFDEAAIASKEFDLTSMKVTLVAPDGTESVLVQPSDGDAAKLLSDVVEEGTEEFSWRFLTNAFWGSDYSKNFKDWTVRIEYDGIAEDGTNAPVDMSGWVTLSSVDFTMGSSVDESAGSIRAGQEVDAHALSIDTRSFVVNGTLCVEDAVYVNGGSLTIAGTVDYYKGELNKGGAVFVQNGGTATLDGAGLATFERGVYLYAGSFSLDGGVLKAGTTGVVVDGGAFTVKPYGEAVSRRVSAVNVSLASGSVSLNERVIFESAITQSGGTFTATDDTKFGSLVMTGGVANLGKVEVSGQLVVGSWDGSMKGDAQTGTQTPNYTGGTLNLNGSIKAQMGLNVAGEGVVKVAANTVLNTTRATAGAAKTAGVVVADAGVFNLGEKASIVGALSLTGGAAKLGGGNEVYSVSVTGGVLDATGVLRTDGLSIGKVGTLKVRDTLTVLAHPAYNTALGEEGDFDAQDLYPKMTLDDGATLLFSAQSHGVSDKLVIGDGQKLVIETGAEINIVYDFGDSLPFATTLIEFTEEFVEVDGVLVPKEDAKLYGFESGTFTISVSNAPTYWSEDLEEEPLSFEIAEDIYGDIVLQSALNDDGKVHTYRLYYPEKQTPLQTAVQKTLLKNEAVAKPFLSVLDTMENISELLSSYEKVGTPSNLIAIDDLHDKQANAITGALSRRARELRSGFIHYDTWSNPLLGNSGFTFSARPNLVAAKGFVPYALEDGDYPLMVWANGGYSFSDADDGAMSVSSSKSSMFNVAMGTDYTISEGLAVGVFLGYTRGRTKFDHNTGNTDIESRNIGVYFAGSRKNGKVGSYYYTAAASVGFEEYDFTRKISVGGLDASAKASPDGLQGIAFIEGGYEWTLQKFSMGPTLSLRYVSNSTDGYTELSADAWMCQETDDLSYDSLQSSVGWRIAYRADFEFCTVLPELRASWNHEFLGTDEDIDLRLALPGAESYSATVRENGDNYATVGAGLSIMLGEVSTISLDYDVQLGRDNSDAVHSFNAMFRSRF